MGDQSNGHDNDHDKNEEQGGTLTIVKPKLKHPPKYKVMLHNDDYSTMEFVMDVLQQFFHMDEQKAYSVMMLIHTQQVAVCGIFSFEIAETKVALVTEYAKNHQFPLKCTMEKE